MGPLVRDKTHTLPSNDCASVGELTTYEYEWHCECVRVNEWSSRMYEWVSEMVRPQAAALLWTDRLPVSHTRTLLSPRTLPVLVGICCNHSLRCKQELRPSFEMVLYPLQRFYTSSHQKVSCRSGNELDCDPRVDAEAYLMAWRKLSNFI